MKGICCFIETKSPEVGRLQAQFHPVDHGSIRLSRNFLCCFLGSISSPGWLPSGLSQPRQEGLYLQCPVQKNRECCCPNLPSRRTELCSDWAQSSQELTPKLWPEEREALIILDRSSAWTRGGRGVCFSRTTWIPKQKSGPLERGKWIPGGYHKCLHGQTVLWRSLWEYIWRVVLQVLTTGTFMDVQLEYFIQQTFTINLQSSEIKYFNFSLFLALQGNWCVKNIDSKYFRGPRKQKLET